MTLAGTWQRICVVGLGGHARTKLLPAIAANGQKLSGLVTRRPGASIDNAPKFASLAEAIGALPPDTLFILSSPPALHFDQAKLILAAGRDLLVEKPAFVTADQAREAARLAEAGGSVLVEAFMHRHTRLYRRLLDLWDNRREEMIGVEAAFLIPRIPESTFREEPEIGASLLYDIGCYPLSLFADLGLSLETLTLESVDEAGSPVRERYRIAGRSESIALSADVGVGPEYRNEAVLQARGREESGFKPFFYGRPAVKSIETSAAGIARREEIADENAFQAMLSVRRDIWRKAQPARIARMIAVTECLERLGEALRAIRQNGGSASAGGCNP